MALIPITFKADLGSESSKGNMRPEDLAGLFAFLYPQEAGILNITGNDLAQDGAINIVGSRAHITFHKGYVVVQGRAIYVEEGTQVAFNLSAGDEAGNLGIRINLAESGANEVTWFQKKASEPLRTNNLLANNESGIYEFVLYNYTATSNTFALGAKTTQIIDNIDDYIKNADYITQEAKDNSKKIATTEFVKMSSGYLDIEGNLQIKAYNRTNASEYVIGEYAFVGNGTFTLNKNGRIVWQGNLYSQQKPTNVNATNNADVGFVSRAKLPDFKITKVNGETVSTSYKNILSLGVLFHNTVAVADNGGRSILQGGAPHNLMYFALEDGKAFRFDRENRLMINNIIIEFQV